MSGLAALLDDIAALVKLTAASLDDVAAAAGRAGVKAAGVVVDDAAVTPQYVSNVDPSRELPIILRITRGSLINKLLIILPLALLLSQFAPLLLTPLLMLGGLYLSFEGAEKVWHLLRPGEDHPAAPAPDRGADAEKTVIRGAILTDFILSTEIMVIALNEVASEPLLNRTLILIAVAIAITIGVYGAVGLIVKMDDIGLALATRKRSTAMSRAFGRGLVKAMPIVLNVLSFVGMLAMLWVGGHILVEGMHKLGLEQPYGWIHDVSEQVAAATGPVGGLLGWLVATIGSLIFGLLVGLVVVAVVSLFHRGGAHHDTEEDAAATAEHAPASAVADAPRETAAERLDLSGDASAGAHPAERP